MKTFFSKEADNTEPKNGKNFNISLHDFTQYCMEHALLITLTITIMALTHGNNIFYNNLGIDTQMFIENPTFTYNWMGIGRFGLLIERFILHLTSFSPYYAGIIFFSFLVASNIVLYYTFYKISHIDFGLINLCIPCIALTSPIWVEQFVYMLQYAEIACAIFLTALATLWIFTWIENKQCVYAILGIICLVISFASYQTFICLYIAFCIFSFILLLAKKDENTSAFIIILKLFITFLIALVGYRILIKILPSNTEYIDNSFFWGSYPLHSIFELIIGHIKDVVKGNGNYYNLGYTIGSIAFMSIIFYQFLNKKYFHKKSNAIWYLLSAIAFIGTPFYMVLTIGNASFIRTQFVLPFTEALLILFVTYYGCKQKWVKYIAIFLVICIFEEQMYMTQTLYYTDKMRNHFDIQTAQSIIEDLEAHGAKEGMPLAIVGHKEAKLNPVCKMGETVGVSMFTLNYNIEPFYIHSSSMIIRLLKCLGYHYVVVSPEQMYEARKTAQNMSVWPEEGSILPYHGYYIIKISEDELPLE